MRIHLRGLFRSVDILMRENPSYFADGAARPDTAVPPAASRSRSSASG
jgi:hypothetical protein